jgi:hypothetical protein
VVKIARCNRWIKVYAPKVSPIYRDKTIQKEPRKALVSVDGGRYGNKFTPILDEILRWRDIIDSDYH